MGSKKVTTLNEDRFGDGEDGYMLISEWDDIDGRFPNEVRFCLYYKGYGDFHQSIALTTVEAQALARHLNSIVGSE